MINNKYEMMWQSYGAEWPLLSTFNPNELGFSQGVYVIWQAKKIVNPEIPYGGPQEYTFNTIAVGRAGNDGIANKIRQHQENPIIMQMDSESDPIYVTWGWTTDLPLNDETEAAIEKSLINTLNPLVGSNSSANTSLACRLPWESDW